MHAHTELSLWSLAGLGAYHGLNPAMGWLFAVALGMQERDRGAIARTLAALALGHAAAVAVALAAAAAVGVVVPLGVLRWLTASALVGFGLYKLLSTRHPRFGSMRIGFRSLVLWSFLMASAHGAGLMLLPFVLGGMDRPDPLSGAIATGVHTAGYLVVTGLVAAVVYERVGLGFLRRGWLNVDLVWALALVAAGVGTVLI